MKLFKNLWAQEAVVNTVRRPACHCLDRQYENESLPWRELSIHPEAQDPECSAWKQLNALIDEAARDGRDTFSPGQEMAPAEWAQITELPGSIARLKKVKHLILYGSSLVRIPPEIGEMTALEKFVPYTSYRLHWFPYEITRCPNLKQSTVSTRALYGSYKYRSPFPRLPQHVPALRPACCSVCQSAFPGDVTPLQYWISLLVATDVLPLLVHACSEQCIRNLPRPHETAVNVPHQGGLELRQPPSKWETSMNDE